MQIIDCGVAGVIVSIPGHNVEAPTLQKALEVIEQIERARRREREASARRTADSRTF